MLNKKVIWSEGMFLLPQHFQQHDRYIEYMLNVYSKRPQRYNWGLLNLDLSQELMLQAKLGLNSAKGIFADGTVFDIPQVDTNPPPLNLSPGTLNTIIYLILPLKREGLPETKIAGTNENQACRFSGEFFQVDDNTTLSNSATQLQLGTLNLSLKPSSEDLAGYNTIGVAKVKEVDSNGKVLLDEDYIPPCLNLMNLSRGNAMVQEVSGYLYQRKTILATFVNMADPQNIPEIQDFLLLQLINRYVPLFDHLLKTTQCTPEEFYLLLIQFISELSTFAYESREVDQLPDYDHLDLSQVFLTLINLLKSYLNCLSQPKSLNHPIEKKDKGIWIARIDNPQIFKDSIFILSIKAKVPDDQIISEFPQQVKIAPLEEINNLIKYALPGLTLKFVGNLPREIPFKDGFIYFELDNKSTFWKRFETSSSIAIHIAGHFPNLEMELWSVKK